jgi:hypothetical protein
MFGFDASCELVGGLEFVEDVETSRDCNVRLRLRSAAVK